MRRQFVALGIAGALILSSAAVSAATTKSTNLTATLSSVGRSGVTGSAGMTISGQMTMLTLTIFHLRPKSVHAVAIHTGRCGSTGTAAAPFALKNIRADKKGVVQTTNTYRGHIASTGRSWHVDVYAGSTTHSRAAVIACGALASPATTPTIAHVATNLAARIRAVGKSGVSGSAGILVSPSTKTTIVALTLSGFGANSTHAAAFFTGRCGSKSAALFPAFPISGFEADASGYVHANDKYTQALVVPSAHLHINVYDSSTVPSGGKSGIVACGDVYDLGMPSNSL